MHSFYLCTLSVSSLRLKQEGVAWCDWWGARAVARTHSIAQGQPTWHPLICLHTLSPPLSQPRHPFQLFFEFRCKVSLSYRAASELPLILLPTHISLSAVSPLTLRVLRGSFEFLSLLIWKGGQDFSTIPATAFQICTPKLITVTPLNYELSG